MRIVLMVVLLALVTAGSTSAQRGPAPTEEPATKRVYREVEAVTMTRIAVTNPAGEEAEIWALEVSGLLARNCTGETQITQRYEFGWLRVEIFAEVDASLTCGEADNPFTLTVPIDETVITFDEDAAGPLARTLAVEVNDYLATAEILETTPRESGPPEVTALSELTPTRRQYVIVEEVEAQVTPSAPALVVLALTVTPPDACGRPLQTRQRRIGDDTVLVQVYTYALADALDCSDDDAPDAVTLNVTLDGFAATGGFDEGEYAYIANGVTGTFNVGPAAQVAGNRVPSLIGSVTVEIAESDPPQVTLVVSGQHPDGCAFPVQTEIARAGTVFEVSVYRIVPGNVMCPMIVVEFETRVELGALEPGEYIALVNELALEFVVE